MLLVDIVVWDSDSIESDNQTFKQSCDLSRMTVCNWPNRPIFLEPKTRYQNKELNDLDLQWCECVTPHNVLRFGPNFKVLLLKP